MCSVLQNSSHEQAIGIFDSGIGGLSIAKCIANSLPNENLVYVADSKYAPYGELSFEMIIERVNTIADWFIEQQCKAIVVACNTATVNAIDQLRKRVNIPIIGVEPAIKPAAIHSKTKNIGILVTTATSKNKRFLALVHEYKNDSNVYIQPCPGLVNLIEQGKASTPECKSLLEQFIIPLMSNNIDSLVLGCTHYPLVVDTIQSIVGQSINVVETAKPVTEQLNRQLINHNLQANSYQVAKYTFTSSANSKKQDEFLSAFWQSQLQFDTLTR